jgi:collagenase-like PrtC family protease
MKRSTSQTLKTHLIVTTAKVYHEMKSAIESTDQRTFGQVMEEPLESRRTNGITTHNHRSSIHQQKQQLIMTSISFTHWLQ